MSIKFGKILRNYRLSVGVKSTHVAETLEVSRAYITTIENSKQPAPTFEKCESLIKLLKLNEKEKLDLYIAAFESRASADTTLFLEEIKRLMTKSKHATHQRLLYNEDIHNDNLEISIPLIEPPTQKEMPPYDKCHIIKYISLSEVESSHYYAIYAKLASNNDYFAYTDKDILLIDPIYQSLSPGDLIYVKVGRKAQIQEYRLLQTEHQLFIQFIPYCNKDNLIFDPISQKNQFEILGKVVMQIKY